MQTFTSSWLTALLVLLPLSTPLSAATDNSQSQSPQPGAETRAWLQLQTSGAQAGPSPRQPGAAASRTYQRYLKSFEQPIPQHYFNNQEGFVNK
jgi:hypothetical protein